MSANLRFNVSEFRKIMAKKKKRVSAASFRPQMEKFVGRALALAAANCPTRDLSLIKAAQEKQYDLWINYVPSASDYTSDPRLCYKANGEDSARFFSRGKWYCVPGRPMPDEDWANFEMLSAERERRMATPRSAFIANRAQARFLYVQQYWLIAKSLGVRAPIAGEAIASKSRRQPPKRVQRPNARWQGGKDILSAVISAPFLSNATKYWQGNGLDILKDASAAERPAFVKSVRDEMIKRLTEK
jgi:hypothetical protein